MIRQWYRMDLHVHSCLSPCAEDDMTPHNIVQMAALEQMDMLAVTDHNAVGNSLETVVIAEDFGIACLYGMEVETREGVHVLVYLPNAFSLLSLEAFIQEHLPMRSHRPDVWGRQLVVGSDGELTEYPWLLSQGTQLSLTELDRKLASLGGLLVPAHADRRSYGLLSLLGHMPAKLNAAAVELVDVNQSLPLDHVIVMNSDAHSLDAMVRPRQRYTYLWGDAPTFEELALGLAGRAGRKVVVGLDEGIGTAFAGFGGKFRKGGS